MASKIREQIGNKLGSIEKRIETAFEKTLEKTLLSAMNSPLTAKAANAAEAAKQSLDQVLLGLEHKLENQGVDVQQKKDLIYAVGKKVLERAEVIRGQVATNSMAPSWIKDINLNDLMPKASAKTSAAAQSETTEATTEATEFGADLASASEGETQAAAPKKAKQAVGATEGDAELAQAAAQGDGEAEEALEASAEEKSAGMITKSSGKGSRQASGKSPIEEAVANTQAGVKQAEAKAKSKKKTSSTETSH